MSEPFKVNPKGILFPGKASYTDKGEKKQGLIDIFGNVWTPEGVYVARMYPGRNKEGDLAYKKGKQTHAPRPRGYRTKAPFFPPEDEPEVIRQLFAIRDSTPVLDKKYNIPFRKRLEALQTDKKMKSFVEAHLALFPKEDEEEEEEEEKKPTPVAKTQEELLRLHEEAYQRSRREEPEFWARADKERQEEQEFQDRMPPDMLRQYLERKKQSWMGEALKREFQSKLKVYEDLPRYKAMLKAAEAEDYEAAERATGEINFDFVRKDRFFEVWDDLPYTAQEYLSEEFFGKTMEEMKEEERQRRREEEQERWERSAEGKAAKAEARKRFEAAVDAQQLRIGEIQKKKKEEAAALKARMEEFKKRRYEESDEEEED